jgi:hypothetical protein
MAANIAQPIGAHANGPVQTSATSGSGTGIHGTTDNTDGSAVSGFRRHCGTIEATANAETAIQIGAGNTMRTAVESGDATVTDPAAHQAASAIRNGPVRFRMVKMRELGNG